MRLNRILLIKDMVSKLNLLTRLGLVLVTSVGILSILLPRFIVLADAETLLPISISESNEWLNLTFEPLLENDQITASSQFEGDMLSANLADPQVCESEILSVTIVAWASSELADQKISLGLNGEGLSLPYELSHDPDNFSEQRHLLETKADGTPWTCTDLEGMQVNVFTHLIDENGIGQSTAAVSLTGELLVPEQREGNWLIDSLYVEVEYSGKTPLVNQRSYLWQYSPEDIATGVIPDNPLMHVKAGEQVALRMQVDNTGKAALESTQYVLQYAKKTGTSCSRTTQWSSLSETSPFVYINSFDQPILTPESGTSSSCGEGDCKEFVAGSWGANQHPTAIPVDFNTELGFTLDTLNAQPGSSYCLRLVESMNEVELTGEYTTYPEIAFEPPQKGRLLKDLKASKIPEILAPQTSFSLSEQPRFELDYFDSTDVTDPYVEGIVEETRVFKEGAFSIVADVVTATGELTSLKPLIRFLPDGQTYVEIGTQSIMRPGEYTLKLDVSEADYADFTIEQDFTWGVLAINVNKSIYLPGDQADIAMTVLNNFGETVCNAAVELSVVSPSGQVSSYSTGGGSVTISDSCAPNNVTYVPDYSSVFIGTEETGTYVMKMIAHTDSGTRTLSDSFEVRPSVDFDIERVGAVRIYPLADYDMIFKVTANVDYEGPVIESVPPSFLVTSEGVSEEIVGAEKELTWDVNWKAGQEYELRYRFDAPDISPEFYKLGPLSIGTFTEARQWQIASDATAGPNAAGAGANQTGVGTIAWTNPGNITANDGANYAVAVLPKNLISNYLVASSFGFSIPTNAAIDGIYAGVDKKEGSTQANGGIKDLEARVLKGGVISGNDYGDTATFWAATDTFAYYGGATDLWGVTWLPADINASTFGFAIVADNVKVAGGGAGEDAYVDYIELTVYYSSPYLQQNHYRWRDDDGSESAATWLQTEDTAHTDLPTLTNVRLRTEVANTGAGSGSGSFQLEYAAKVGASCGDDETFTVIPVTATTEHFEMTTSGNVSDGTATTAQLTATGTFTAGKVVTDPSNSTGSITIANGNYTENEYNFQATASGLGDYCFRTTDSGTVLDNYSVYPEVSVIAASNTAPNSPTSLVQKKTDDTVIVTADWTDETSVKFTAQATDADNPDTLYLCIEADELGTSFSDTEDSCGSGVAYSGSAVEVTHTLTGLTQGGEYHWQARIKDEAAAYSAWASYDVNAETEIDFGIDTSAPTVDNIYDGPTVSVDVDVNTGSLTVIEANWAGTDNESGIKEYEYAIGTTSGGTEILTWTSAGVSTSFNETIVTAGHLHTGQTYYTSVRATNNAETLGSVLTSDGIQVLPTFSFSVDSSSINFLNLNPGTSWTDTQTTTTTASTNAYGGYLVTLWISQDLTNTISPSDTISNYAGTNATPTVWSGLGFGYTTNDTTLSGGTADRFTTGGPKYAGYTLGGSGDPIADHTAAVTGQTGAVSSESFTITYKVQVDASQVAGPYTTNIVYIATPTF